MSLRRKALLIHVFTLVGLVSVLYFLSSQVLLLRLSAADDAIVRSDMRRMLSVLQVELDHLRIHTRDCAVRDSIYSDMRDADAAYNLAVMRHDIAVVMDPSSRVVFRRSVDAGGQAGIPDGLIDYLSQPNPFIAEDAQAEGHSGIVALPMGPVLAASHPVLPGDGAGTPRGMLVICRLLDHDAIQRLSKIAQLPMRVQSYSHPSISQKIKNSLAGIVGDTPVLTKPSTSQWVTGYALLRDAGGKPAFIISSEVPRTMYREGRGQLRYLLYSMLSLTLAYTLITMGLLQRAVISRVSRIAGAANHIASTGNVAARLPMTGRDELSRLSRAINIMLESLERSQWELRKANNELEARVERRTTELSQAMESLQESRQILDTIMEHVPVGIIVADAPDVTFHSFSKYTSDLLGQSISEAKGSVAREQCHTITIFHPDGVTPAAMKELPLTRAVKHGETVIGEEWVLQTESQGELHVLCNAAPVQDSSGKVTGGVLVFMDMEAIRLERDALEKAYAVQRRIADVLQQALIPEDLPVVHDFDLAACYRPAARDAQVGGDFYDLFPLDDGRLVLVVADVSGKGLPAAVYTAMAKYTVRACAVVNPEPAWMMEYLNKIISLYTPDDVFATVFCAVLDPAARTLVFTSAGHDEPLFYHSSLREVIPLRTDDIAVGILPDYEYRQKTLKFSAGDVLLIYTDGITDVAGGGLHLDLHSLSSILTLVGSERARQICDQVLRAACDTAQGSLRDDATLLVLKVNSASY